MNQPLTAEELFGEISRMPVSEREKFFALLARSVFPDDNFTHEQVFGDLHQALFSAKEAAEYLEISLPTLRRYVQSGRLAPTDLVGRNQMFAPQALRAFKQARL